MKQLEKGVYTLPDLLHFRTERVKNIHMAFDEENSESPPSASMLLHSSQLTNWQTTLFQVAHDAFVIHDDSGRVLFWNPGATTLYGWSEQEALGQQLDTLLGTQFSSSRVEIEPTLR